MLFCSTNSYMCTNQRLRPVVVHVAWQCKIDMQCNRTVTRNAHFKINNDDPILSIL